MTQEEFFDTIKSECDSDASFIIELLKVRGFLFEERKDKIVLSDNSHESDYLYLNDLLQKYNIGHMEQNEVVITNLNYADFVRTEFRENNQINAASCTQHRNWRWFKRRKHGEKAAVSWLEPFIARYIKAISACCVMTVSSCDGNHYGKHKMVIMTEGEGSIPWYKLICEKCLVNKFNIDWSNDYTTIRFDENTKYLTYYEVNRAAEFLYSNRKAIRQIKDTVLNGMPDRYLRHHTSEEIETEFIKKASDLFDCSSMRNTR